MNRIRIHLLTAVILALMLYACGQDRQLNNVIEPPEILGTISSPDTVYTDSFFLASVIVADPQGLDVQARFNWGDGTVSDYSPLSSSGTEFEIPYAYRNTGVYEISVSARNRDGLITTDENAVHQITVLEKEPGALINDLLLHNNRFLMTTTTPVNLTFSYRKESFQGEIFDGYSADVKLTYFDFSLPVEDAGFEYEMILQLKSNSTVKDTTLTFISTASVYPLLRVDFVDVRQGDGTLIQTPEGHSIAVDGGYGTYIPPFSSGYWTGQGYPFMLDYVINENIGHFRYLVETHNHMDHYGGLHDIKNFGISYDYYLSPDSTHSYTVGDFLNVNSAVNFQILNIDFPPGISTGNENNRSVVLRIEYGDIAYLLTGDIEYQVESYLVDNNFPLSADVLKVAHHGSQTSSRQYFLNRVFDRHAKIATISFGTGNPYNHPHNLNRFASYEVYGTGQPDDSYNGDNFRFNAGDIKTYSDGTVIIVSY